MVPVQWLALSLASSLKKATNKMSLADILQFSNVLVIPAFGYIIILERRITKMQVQIEVLIDRLRTTP